MQISSSLATVQSNIKFPKKTGIDEVNDVIQLIFIGIKSQHLRYTLEYTLVLQLLIQKEGYGPSVGLRHDSLTCIVCIPWSLSKSITFRQLNHPPDDRGQEGKMCVAIPSLRLMLFWLDQTSPKAWGYHLPSLLALWMIHVGPWDWEWTTVHVMETLLYMQSWACPHMYALTSSGSGRAFGCDGRWWLLCKDPGSFILIVNAMSWFLSSSLAPHTQEDGQQMRPTCCTCTSHNPGWWAWHCAECMRDISQSKSESPVWQIGLISPTLHVLTGSASSEQLLKHWESEVKGAIH